MAATRTQKLRRNARTVVSSAAGALGYELVRRHYYSPIPDLRTLPADVWTRESELAGIAFDPRAGLDFVRAELAAFLAEYDPPVAADGDVRNFHLDTGMYESLDAETLYAMVRRFDPPRILELGSGMSTLVIADARSRNGREDRTGHVVCDPYARADLAPALSKVAELRPVGVTEIAMDEFTALAAGDLLFVDTTHTVKIGGDVNRVILDVLPRLAPGVIVHIHDIYLPWEYPREFLDQRRFFWAEQYLLQAFLAFNDRFETLFGNHALARRFPQEIATMLCQADVIGQPSAFWMRRVDG
jgi:predicted O-methyltransferase YrrM